MLTWLSKTEADQKRIDELFSNFMVRPEELEELQLSHAKVIDYIVGVANLSSGCWEMLIYNDTVPIACYGVQQLHFGVGHLWMFNSVLMPRYKVSLIKRMREAVYAHDTMGWHRVQAYASTLWSNRKAFAEAIGLRQEGIARAYGVRGEDYYVMARVSTELQRRRLLAVTIAAGMKNKR